MSTTENKKIVDEINQEIDNKKREELKNAVRAYKQMKLEQREKLSSEKEKIEEQLRINKLDLENIDKGNFSAIEERMRKSEMARKLDPTKQVEKIIEIWREFWPVDNFKPLQPPYNPWITWSGTNFDNGTAGTFQVGNKTFYF